MDVARLADLLVTGLMRGGIYSLMAVGLALIFGVMNISNFAHGEFYMIGAYAAYYGISLLQLHPLLAIALGMAVAVIAGVVIEAIAFVPLRRLSGAGWVMNAFLLTLGISFVLQNLALRVLGSTYRGVTQYWPGVLTFPGGYRVSADRLISFCVAILAIAALWLFLYRTQTGRAIRAVGLDERGATLVGISLARIHRLTFGLSTGLAGLAGATLLYLTQAYPTVGSRPLTQSWFVMMLVGLGNIPGAVVGGLIVGLVDAFSISYLGAGWQDVVTVTVLIIILLVKPSGLFGSEVKGIWER